MRRAGAAAAAAVIGWYVFALWILHPLTDAPVVDSWLYGSAVRRFLRTGEIRFAGYSQAMPVAQVFYGVAWAHAFGGNSASLEISTVVLAILCGVMFHALAIKCGAPRWQAFAATGLLICNPCFTFLSFSFMTEIPFLTAMVAAHLAFAKAEGPREQLWLWLRRDISGDRIHDSAVRRDGDRGLRRRDAPLRPAAARNRIAGTAPCGSRWWCRSPRRWRYARRCGSG